MKTLKSSNNYISTPIQRWTGLLLTSCFFLGVVVLTMHHHDAFFPLKSCAICKAKTSLSSIVKKVTADSLLSIPTICHCSESNFNFLRIDFYYQAPFIASFPPSSFLNKAPPSIAWFHTIEQVASEIFKVTRKHQEKNVYPFFNWQRRLSWTARHAMYNCWWRKD